jgi:hypothetical protein
VDIDPKFSHLLNETEFKRFCGSLIKGNSFCLKHLSRVLVLNSDGFEQVFQAIELPLKRHFDDPDTQAAAFSLIIDVSTANFNATNETVFLPLFAVLLRRSDVSADHRLALLKQIRFLLLNKSTPRTATWSSILTSISIADVQVSHEVIACAFSILETICNDHLNKLNIEDYQTIVSLIFEFSSQTIEINICLSSLGLLWLVLPFVRDRMDFWHLILNGTILFFSDSRNDVAVCALRTFFTLLTLDAGQLPTGIYSHLVVGCFVPQLMAMTEFSPDSWSMQQLTFQEMCHCGISFWTYFDTVPEFVTTFWPLLIEKQEIFLKLCKDPEVCISAFAVYDESFPVPYFTLPIRQLLQTSFISVMTFFLENEPPNSLVLSTLGRFIHKIVLSQKQFLTANSLTGWLEFYHVFCRLMPCDSFVTLSVHKALEGLIGLLPLSDSDMNRQICRALVHIVIRTSFKCLREEIIGFILSALRKIELNLLHFMVDCIPLFGIPESSDLISFFVASNVADSERGEFFDCLRVISEARADLKPVIYLKLLDLLVDVDLGRRESFLQENSERPVFFRDVWLAFCNPLSKRFHSEFYGECFGKIIASVSRFLIAATADELAILDLLAFLASAKVPPRSILSFPDCDTWFLFDLMPPLIILAADSRAPVRAAVTKVLAVARDSLAKAVPS